LSGNLKWIESTIACSTIEIESAMASTRDSGSSLASGWGQGHADELKSNFGKLNLQPSKSFVNHAILGGF
jgi:hypothetical protein